MPRSQGGVGIAGSVAIHSLAEEGLSFYPDYDLLEELFSNPALISRRRYREIISGFLGDPDISPEALRRLADRDPAKASTVFTRWPSRQPREIASIRSAGYRR